MADLPHRLQHEDKFAKQIAEILARHQEQWKQDRTVETERDLDEGLLALLILLFGLGANSAAGELGIALVVSGRADAWARPNATGMARRVMFGIGRRLQRARVADLNTNPGLNTIFNQTVESILLPKTWGNFAATEVTRAYTAGGEDTAFVYNIGRLMPDRSGALFTTPTDSPLPRAGDDLVPPREVPGEPISLPEPAVAIWHTSESDDIARFGKSRVCPICKPLDGRPRDEWTQSFPLGPPGHDGCRCWLDYSTGEAES